MNNRWLYIGTGLGVLGVTFLVLAVSNTPTKKQREQAKKDSEPKPYEPPKEKSSISSADIGKKIHTKSADTNLRGSARINNGWINNIEANVKAADTYIGIVKAIEIPDEKYTNPATMKPYVWVKFNYAAQPSKELFVREDVIVLK